MRRIVASAAGAALVVLAALVVAGVLTAADRYALRHLMPWYRPGKAPHLVVLRYLFVPETRSSLGGTLVGVYTFPASPFVSALIVGVCALATRCWSFVAAWVVVNVVELLGKVLLTRPSLGVDSFRHSFPSGHTARAFVVAAVVWWTWRRVGWLALAWSLGVPFALVALGDHAPTDVVGGALLAVCVLGAMGSGGGQTSVRRPGREIRPVERL